MPRARSSPACCTSIAAPRICIAHLNTVEEPLNQFRDACLCPGGMALEALNASLR